jgi:glycosyltransferase involved in cell wall biosynthesis
MKALVCSINAPWPPLSGVELRCWQILNVLPEPVEVGLFALAGNRTGPPDFRTSLWHVTGPVQADPPATGWLQRPDGLPSDAYYTEGSADDLRRVLKDFAPDVVILDQLWMHGYEHVIRGCPARIVLNTHNVEAALACEIASRERFPPARYQRRVFAERTEKLEREIAGRMDQIWVCSERDRAWFVEKYQVSAPVHVVPNAIDTDRYALACARPRELDGLNGPVVLFSGVFSYPPNISAAHFLIREIFPKLAERYPAARLLLAGANPTSEMLAAAESDSRIVVTGRIPDTIPYLKHASLMLVPLFEGGGTRFKIIEAFAAKVPVVSSAKGVEGLQAEPGVHFLAAETPAEFLNAIEEIIGNPSRREIMVQCAAKLAERFSWRTARQIVSDALRSLDR